MTLNNLVCYSDPGLHLKAYHVLTRSSRLSQQAGAPGTCPGTAVVLPTQRCAGALSIQLPQDPFSSCMEHPCEILVARGFEHTRCPGRSHPLLTSFRKLSVNHGCFSPHVAVADRAPLHNSDSLQLPVLFQPPTELHCHQQRLRSSGRPSYQMDAPNFVAWFARTESQACCGFQARRNFESARAAHPCP